jgi:aryl-phospho-beta-D-glucosidase BglC (GH1 family)
MKNLTKGFQAGINLGGWIAQFKEANKEHFDSFITEADIKQIAYWGMDHVRLPIDYNVIEDDSNPFHYKEDGFAYVDQCIRWCEEQNLNIILDLHKAAGYAFYMVGGADSLFEEEELQNRFLSLWQAFAVRYKNYGDNVAFELLNEIVEPNSDRWNKLSRRAVEKIREIDKNRIIIIGGNNYNSVFALKELDRIDDDRLVYNFHFYEPHIFTHQKADWEIAMKGMDFTVHYPTKAEDAKHYQSMSEDFKHNYDFKVNMGKDYIKDLLRPALFFMAERNVNLYCGEYGVIDQAPEEDSLRWHQDFCELLIHYGIGRAVWNYKLMSFPIVDKKSQVVNERLIRIISRK